MPRIRRGSSTRLMGCPMRRVALIRIKRVTKLHRYIGSARQPLWPCQCITLNPSHPSALVEVFGRVLNGINDVRIAGAAAEVAIEAVGDLFSGRLGVAIE